MQLLFDSQCKNFLEMYEPEITVITDIEVAADEYATKWFIHDIEGLNPTVENIDIETLKNVYGFRINKNHAVIPKDTQLTIVDMGKPFEPLVASIKGLKFEMYITFEADGTIIEATPKNKEFEAVFANKNIPKKEDNIMLYGINIVDLVNAVNYNYIFPDVKIAYEYLKVLTEQQVMGYYRTYKQYYDNLLSPIE